MNSSNSKLLSPHNSSNESFKTAKELNSSTATFKTANDSFTEEFDISLDNLFNQQLSNELILKSNQSSKATINHLTNELINLILKNFSLNQLPRLRLINKKFKNVIDKLSINELIISNRYDLDELVISNRNDLDELNYNWYFTSRKLNYKNFLNLNLNYKFFRNKFFEFKKLRNLKIISALSSTCFRLSDLNQFTELEELDMNIKCLKRENENLNLINLKYLSINCNLIIKIIINTPKLIKFYYNQNLENVKFIDYTSIIHLEIIDYSSEIYKFVNLKYLYLIRAYQIDENILDHLINLDEFNFLSTIEPKYISNSFNNFYKETFTKISKLFDEINSKNLKTKIYLFGIRLDDKKDFYNVTFDDNYLDLHFNCYQFLNSNLNWFKYLNYYNLIKLTNCNLPENFFTIYTNIQQFEVLGKSFNEEFLFKFLNSTNLKILKLINLDKENNFYHNLPAYCLNLNKLKIEDEINIGIDLDYFIKFNLLSYFETNQNFKMNKIINLIENLSFFRKFKFFCRVNDEVKIERIENDQFILKYNEYADEVNKKKRIKINEIESSDKVKEACLNIANRSFFS